MKQPKLHDKHMLQQITCIVTIMVEGQVVKEYAKLFLILIICYWWE